MLILFSFFVNMRHFGVTMHLNKTWFKLQCWTNENLTCWWRLKKGQSHEDSPLSVSENICMVWRNDKQNILILGTVRNYTFLFSVWIRQFWGRCKCESVENLYLTPHEHCEASWTVNPRCPNYSIGMSSLMHTLCLRPSVCQAPQNNEREAAL